MRKFLIPILLLTLFLSCNSPAAETQEAREQRIQWWREARFGMFIHWGLYAIPGGTWKDKVHNEGYSEWIMFDEKIPAREYEKLAGKFNPVKFDAQAWAGIAKKAGMKYMVLTTKHHDGFSMFHSSLTPYNVADATPFKRDVTRELVGCLPGCRPALRLLLFDRPRLVSPARPGKQLQADQHLGLPGFETGGFRPLLRHLCQAAGRGTADEIPAGFAVVRRDRHEDRRPGRGSLSDHPQAAAGMRDQQPDPRLPFPGEDPAAALRLHLHPATTRSWKRTSASSGRIPAR